MTPETRDLLAAYDAGSDLAESVALVGRCVRAILSDLSAAAPGRSVELRVPPHGATQIVAGPTHRRGTPKATVEMSPGTLIALARGEQDWAESVRSGTILASGERADLSTLFPI